MPGDFSMKQNVWWLKCLLFAQPEPTQRSDFTVQVSSDTTTRLPNTYQTEDEALDAARKFLVEIRMRLEEDMQMLSKRLVAPTGAEENEIESWVKNTLEAMQRQYGSVERCLWAIA